MSKSPKLRAVAPDDIAKIEELNRQLDQNDRRASRIAKQIAISKKVAEGLTQEQMAARAGWTQGQLALYLNGSKPIGRHTLSPLCVALDCEPHDIRPELKNPAEEKNIENYIREARSTLTTALNEMGNLEKSKARDVVEASIRKQLEDLAKLQ